MKKLLFITALLVLGTAASAQEKFVVKEHPTTDLHQRSIALAYSSIINAMSVAKSAGMDVETFSTKMGQNWAKTWQKEAGFETFTNGMIWNWTSFLAEGQPEVEILEQNDRMAKVKVYNSWAPLFAEGPVFGVTKEEMTTFWNITLREIADYVAVTCETQTTDDYLTMTIKPK